MGDLGLYLAGAAGTASVRALARLVPRQRLVPARHPQAARASPGRSTSRDIPDTCGRAVGVERVDEQPQRHADARVPDDARRDRDRRRVGRERVWDLAERVYPADVVVPSVDEAERPKNERRLASLGIARAKATEMPMEPIHVGDAGEPAVVEGVKGEWRVDPAALDDDFEGRTALLSPFDRLVHDRDRARGALRLRVHARDVQAGREAPLGLLRAPDPPRRPARREARRDRRPQGVACCA